MGTYQSQTDFEIPCDPRLVVIPGWIARLACSDEEVDAQCRCDIDQDADREERHGGEFLGSAHGQSHDQKHREERT